MTRENNTCGTEYSVTMSLPGMIGLLSTIEKLIFSSKPFSAPIHWKSNGSKRVARR